MKPAARHIVLYSGLMLLGYSILLRAIIGSFNVLVWLHVILTAVLFLTYFISWVVSRRKIEAANSASLLSLRAFVKYLLLTTIVVTLNLFVNMLDFKFDATTAKVNALSETSLQVLTEIEKPFEFLVIKQNNADQEYKNLKLVELFQQAAPKIVAVNVIDPLLQPVLARELGLVSGDQIAIRSKEAGVIRLGKVSELRITEALNELTIKEQLQAVYLQGHGQPQLDDAGPEGALTFAITLKKQGILLKNHNFSDFPEIPAKTKLLFIVAPQNEFSKSEITVLSNYSKSGGNLVIFAEPSTNIRLNDLINNFGIKIQPAVVLDNASESQNAQEASWQISISQFAKHAITQNLTASNLVTLLYAAPLGLDREQVNSGNLLPLMITRSKAWAETDLTALNASTPIAVQDKLDIPGPLVMAAAYQANTADNRGRVVVVADATWINNHNLNFHDNSRLAIEIAKWAAGIQTTAAKPTRNLTPQLALISAINIQSIMLWSLLLSELILLFGLVMLWRRSQLIDRCN